MVNQTEKFIPMFGSEVMNIWKLKLGTNRNLKPEKILLSELPNN